MTVKLVKGHRKFFLINGVKEWCPMSNGIDKNFSDVQSSLLIKGSYLFLLQNLSFNFIDLLAYS